MRYFVRVTFLGMIFFLYTSFSFSNLSADDQDLADKSLSIPINEAIEGLQEIFDNRKQELEAFQKKLYKRFEGFAEGTLIKTASGYLPIEQLKYGDFIAGSEGEQEIVGIKKFEVDHYVCLQTNKNEFLVSKYQQFFLEDGSTKPAGLLKSGDQLTKDVVVQAVVPMSKPYVSYCIMTEESGFYLELGVRTHTCIGVCLIRPEDYWFWHE